MGRIAALAGAELRIAARNRWLAVAVALMCALSLVLEAVGSAPGGQLGVDRLTVAVAGLTTLGAYLVPLLALLLAFDAIAGEAERGTLSLLATYPLRRGEILAGKFAAHLAVLAIAIFAGFGAAGAIAIALDAESADSLPSLLWLAGTALLLGAGFLALGYVASCLGRASAGAAGYAVAIWLLMVVFYDLALLGAVVADDGGAFSREALPWLLAANPADAFRLVNLADGPAAVVTGLAAAGKAVPRAAVHAALWLWPLAALAAAWLLLSRREL